MIRQVQAFLCPCGELHPSMPEAVECCGISPQPESPSCCEECGRKLHVEEPQDAGGGMCEDCIDTILSDAWHDAEKQSAPHDGRIWSERLAMSFRAAHFLEDVLEFLARCPSEREIAGVRGVELTRLGTTDISRLLRCYLMEPDNPPPFDAHEWFGEFLPPGQQLKGGWRTIERLVNRYIASRAPWDWRQTSVAWNGRVGEPAFETGFALEDLVRYGHWLD